MKKCLTKNLNFYKMFYDILQDDLKHGLKLSIT